MAIFSSTQPSLRTRLLPRFPAQVLAGSGITINKSGGTYTFSATPADIDLSQLADISTDRLLGRDTAGTGEVEELDVSNGLEFTGSGGVQIGAAHRLRQFTVTGFTPGGSPIAANSKADFYVPFACTLTAVTVLVDAATNLVLDVWKDVFANYPPTVADTITASAKPTLSAATSYRDTTLTGWTTSFSAGDTIRVNVDSNSAAGRIMFLMEVRL